MTETWGWLNKFLSLPSSPNPMNRTHSILLVLFLMLVSPSLEGCRRGTFLKRTINFGDRSASAVKRPKRKQLAPGKKKLKPKKKINSALLNR